MTCCFQAKIHSYVYSSDCEARISKYFKRVLKAFCGAQSSTFRGNEFFAFRTAATRDRPQGLHVEHSGLTVAQSLRFINHGHIVLYLCNFHRLGPVFGLEWALKMVKMVKRESVGHRQISSYVHQIFIIFH